MVEKQKRKMNRRKIVLIMLVWFRDRFHQYSVLYWLKQENNNHINVRIILFVCLWPFLFLVRYRKWQIIIFYSVVWKSNPNEDIIAAFRCALNSGSSQSSPEGCMWEGKGPRERLQTFSQSSSRQKTSKTSKIEEKKGEHKYLRMKNCCQINKSCVPCQTCCLNNKLLCWQSNMWGKFFECKSGKQKK